MQRALITGITGQDGSYLAELLLSKGYEVHGIIRRASSFNTQRINHVFDKLYLHYGDLLDGSSLHHVMMKAKPNEVYNLAAQSHVRTSFDQPVYTADTVYLGTLRLLEALRDYRDHSGKDVRFYQASSSEMFGKAPPPQSEDTPFMPRSPYACAKVAAFYQVVNYREAYALRACNGILFNHESPRRGETFVTRKATRAATRIHAGLQDVLHLGNLDARRDWGHAGDYARAMWMMLQHDKPDDYVVATGVSASVQDWVEEAFEQCDLDWREYVKHDSRLERPTEVDYLCGDATKAADALGWKSAVTWRELCSQMVQSDMLLATGERGAKDALAA